MESQESVKKCVDNAHCPRTERIMQLLAQDDKRHAGILGAMDVAPSGTDAIRSARVTALAEQLDPSPPNEEKPITPLTCEVFQACRAAVAALDRQMMNERGGASMLGMGGRMPYPRQF